MTKSKKEIIAIQRISKIYHLGDTVVKALDDVSLSIYENDFIAIRSEERRVGKECRSRWSPYH